MTPQELSWQLARALGVPEGMKATRVVLTLETGKLPTVDIEAYLFDKDGKPCLVKDSGFYGYNAPHEIKSIQYMLRLVPFDER